MQLDADLVGILHQIARGNVTESYSYQTIVKLMLELQQARQTIRVMKNLDPQTFGPAVNTVDTYTPNPPTVAEKWFEQHDARIGKVEEKG